MKKMSLTKYFIVFVIALQSLTEFVNAEDNAALTMVKKFGLGKNLVSMSYLVAFNTQTYKIITSDIGETKAQALVKSEINVLLPKYQEQWNQNLAATYTLFFNDTELDSLKNEGQSSKYFSKVKEEQNDIGANMQQKSNELLQALVSEAMLAAFSKTVPEK
jgi:hypothetical protein